MFIMTFNSPLKSLSALSCRPDTWIQKCCLDTWIQTCCYLVANMNSTLSCRPDPIHEFKYAAILSFLALWKLQSSTIKYTETILSHYGCWSLNIHKQHLNYYLVHELEQSYVDSNLATPLRIVLIWHSINLYLLF